MGTVRPVEMDAEALIEPVPAGDLHLPRWRACIDPRAAWTKTVPPKTLFHLVAIIAGTLLVACGALAWSLVSCQSHNKQPNACASFFMDIAAGNLDDWVVPTKCGSAVKDYVENGQYEADFAAAVESVRTFVNTLGPPGQDGLDMWILDIDETSLSNVPFFEKYTDWGTEEWTAAVQELWDSWVMEGTARALVPTLELFQEMRRTGWQVAFITGRSEAQRNVTKSNLLAAGYSGWQSLTLRSPEEMDEPATVYKSRHRQDLVSQGYRILGGMGDQWSDLQGQAAGQRTFKLPNPMYYVG